MTGGSDDELIHLGPLAEDRKRVVTQKRRARGGSEMLVDATRVSGPIRMLLEPLLWFAFAIGVMWILIALDPALREDDPSIVIHEYAGPLGLLLGAVLLVSSISALLWLGGSVTATRSRSAVAGLGMLGAGWLFSALHPVRPEDFEQHSLISYAVGALLIAVCAVPWPTSPARLAGRMTPVRAALVAVLLAAVAVVAYQVWSAARDGLVGVGANGSTGWQDLLPLLAVMVMLLAAVRFVIRRPGRDAAEPTRVAR